MQVAFRGAVMIFQIEDGAASSSTATQAERDELDNKAVQEAWLSLAGTLPVSTEQSIGRGEVFYSALDLAEYLIGSSSLAGWRISFTTDGGPYVAVLLLNGPRDETQRELTASHPTSLALAFTSVIRKWADVEDDRR
jgi:hypothetical protein